MVELPELVVRIRGTATEWPLLILIGQLEAELRGGAEVEGVGGTLVANVVDLSRNMYLTNRTTDRASVTIWRKTRERNTQMAANAAQETCTQNSSRSQ